MASMRGHPSSLAARQRRSPQTISYALGVCGLRRTRIGASWPIVARLRFSSSCAVGSWYLRGLWGLGWMLSVSMRAL